MTPKEIHGDEKAAEEMACDAVNIIHDYLSLETNLAKETRKGVLKAKFLDFADYWDSYHDRE